jgi:tetratricopeptide (TPR) repeat protein
VLHLEPAEPGVSVGELADQDAALAWFDAENDVVLALVELAAREEFDQHAWQLAWILTDYHHRMGRWHDWVRSHETALAAAARLGDRNAMAVLHRSISYPCGRIDAFEEAARHGRAALALFREAGEVGEWANTHLRLSGLAIALGDRADDDARRDSRRRQAVRHSQRAAELFHASGDRTGEARALSCGAWAQAKLGDFREAIMVCAQAVTLLEDLGLRRELADTWDTIAYAHRRLGERPEAIAAHEQAMTLYVEDGDRLSVGETLVIIGEVHLDGGDLEATRDAWGRALAIFDDIEHPDAGPLRLRLSTL